MVSDPIGDMLARIRNASLAGHRQVKLPYSQLKESLAKLLVAEGFLKKVEVEDGDYKSLVLSLKYNHQTPVITKLQRLSKPGRRLYMSAKEIRAIRRKLGTRIFSSSAGLLTEEEMIKKNMGGEAICRIW